LSLRGRKLRRRRIGVNRGARAWRCKSDVLRGCHPADISRGEGLTATRAIGAVVMTKRIFLLITAMLAGPAMAQAPAPRPPKLVVAIVVDQFSAELFERYRDRFAGGLG